MSETAEAPPEGVDEPDELICTICDEGPFASKLLLGAHRFHKHGIRGSSPKAGTSSSKKRKAPRTESAGAAGEGESRRQERRRKAVRDTLIELVGFTDEARGRSDEEAADLSDVIRRDADKLANSVAWIAERFLPLGRAIDLLFGHGGPLTVARGFLGIGTWTLAHWRQTLQGRAEAAELVEPGQTAEEIAEQMGREYLL